MSSLNTNTVGFFITSSTNCFCSSFKYTSEHSTSYPLRVLRLYSISCWRQRIGITKKKSFIKNFRCVFCIFYMRYLLCVRELSNFIPFPVINIVNKYLSNETRNNSETACILQKTRTKTMINHCLTSKQSLYKLTYINTHNCRQKLFELLLSVYRTSSSI